MPPATHTDALLDGLNPEQRAMVRHEGAPLLCLAGAGTGKTHALTHRIAWLQATRPDDGFLALTFTNKAAREMRRRVEALLRRPVPGDTLGTFHAVCLRLLRSVAPRAGLDPAFSVIDDGERRAILRDAMIGHHGQGGFDAADLSEAAEAIDIHQNTWSSAAPPDIPEHLRPIAEAYAGYKLRRGLADFGDILVHIERLLSTDGRFRDACRRRWPLLLVDEFQDVNRVQNRIVQLLAGNGLGLTAVGDEDQNVYLWRQAEPRVILDFRRDYPNARLCRLELNYRSTPQILAATNRLLTHNRERLGKTLRATLPDGPPPEILDFATTLDEAEHIALLAQDAAELGHSLAVLARLTRILLPIERALIRRGVPYILAAGRRFADRAVVKDILAWLRIALNPSDLPALRRAVAAPKRGIGDGTVDWLADDADRADRPVADHLRRLHEAGHLPKRHRAAFAAWIEALDGLRLDLRQGRPPRDTLEALIERTGYRPQQLDDEDEADAVLDHLLDLAAEAESIENLMEQLALLDGGPDRPDAPRVWLGTIHAAKGLEWDEVIVAGADDPIMPHRGAIADEEERRLMHVATTRARRVLRYSTCERRPYIRSGDTPAILAQSPYLAELGLM